MSRGDLGRDAMVLEVNLKWKALFMLRGAVSFVGFAGKARIVATLAGERGILTRYFVSPLCD